MQEKATSAKDAVVSAYRTASADPARTMTIASTVSGILLIMGGVSGAFNFFNPLAAVISIYNMCACAFCPRLPAHRHLWAA